MAEAGGTLDHPLVLVINDEEWATRAIESVLKPEGYAILMAYTGRQGIDLASRIRPDLILVDFRLPDLTAKDLCTQLRSLPTVRASTPIVVYSAAPIPMKDRMAAYRAGAWAILRHPINPQELLAQLRPFIAAKRDTDVALAASDIDSATGFYTMQGLMRRGREMTADMGRSRRPLACVVLGPSGPQLARSDEGEGHGSGRIPTPPESVGGPQISGQVAQTLLSLTRLSDAIGRTEDSDFVILAPGTDLAGAVRLAERITNAVEEGTTLSGEPPLDALRVKAGLYVVSGEEPETVIPDELFRRASHALQTLREEGNGARVRPFRASAGEP